MKQSIRYNTFETNSSSMHSLVVVKDPKPYSSDEQFSNYCEDKEFNLFWYDEGVYGRFPFQVLRTPLDKLRYYVAFYIGANKQTELIPKVIDFIHEQTGIAKKKINIKAYNEYESKYEGYGYASINDTGEDVFTYIEKNNISMEEFVLNPKYIVIVDGDEYQEFKKLFRSNILNANDFEYISSGTSFWDDDIYDISLYCLNREDYDISEVMYNISKFIKKVRLNFWDDIDCINSYKNNTQQIETIIDGIKKQYPQIILSVGCCTNIVNEVKMLDLSNFDFLEVFEYCYHREPVEIIQTKNS